MRTIFSILLFSFLLPMAWMADLSAATIKGKITDKQTGEELVGCAVYLQELKLGTTSGFDGTYELKNVPAGSYTLQTSYITYEGQTQKITVGNAPEVIMHFTLVPTVESLFEVVVVSKADKTTEQSARATEKNSMQIINVVSAKSIELSPDLNVAAVLQRMSGVTMERNSSGEAQYAILRGMDKRYNYTLVNGVKLPSPDNKYRYLPLDIFPSELLDRIEVTKSLTADMEADATGGVVNLVMKDAPSRFMLQGNAALGYNTHFFNNKMLYYPVNDIMLQSPRKINGSAYKATMADFNNASAIINEKNPLPNGTIGLTIGNRLFDNKFGFVVAANYQNFNKGNTCTIFEDYIAQGEATVRLSEMQERVYSENQTQYGLHSKLDFRINPNHKLEWYNAYLFSRNAQIRQVDSYELRYYYPESGDFDMSYKTRVRTQIQNIFNSTLQGTHQLGDKLSSTWSLVYSKAQNNLPDNNQIYLDQMIESNVPGLVYVDGDGSNRRWENNSDQDIAVYINLNRESNLGNGKLNIKAGGMFRDKDRTNDYVNYRFKPANDSQVQGEDFNTLDEINWLLDTPLGSVNTSVYDAGEQITAGYISIGTKGEKWYTGIGLRSEYTNQSYHMPYPNAGDSPDGGQKYLDLFPSMQLKFTPSNKVNWKASYFRSVNRPGFFEIVPYQMIYEDHTEYGNPDLKQALIDNIDFRWEYFPSNTEQLMVGLFYKQIQDPIEFIYITVSNSERGYMYRNMEDATNFGAEIDAIKFIRQFGIKANYTYTHSSITTPKKYYSKDANGNTTMLSQNQVRPLVRQAGHAANLSFMYKSTNHGWDAQLAASFLGEKIDWLSEFYNADTWQTPTFQLDASAEKKLKGGFSLFAKANNILQTPRKQFIKTSNPYNNRFPLQQANSSQTIISDNHYGTTFLVGIRLKR